MTLYEILKAAVIYAGNINVTIDHDLGSITIKDLDGIFDAISLEGEIYHRFINTVEEYEHQLECEGQQGWEEIDVETALAGQIAENNWN